MIPCPYCSSLCTVPIAYGMPGKELQRAASRGLVELGSCVVDDSCPTRRCLDCGSGWREPAHLDAAAFLADALVLVQKYREHMTMLTYEYGAACVAYGRSFQDGYEEARELFPAMLQGYREVERAWDRLFVEAEEWRIRYAKDDPRDTIHFSPG